MMDEVERELRRKLMKNLISQMNAEEASGMMPKDNGDIVAVGEIRYKKPGQVYQNQDRQSVLDQIEGEKEMEANPPPSDEGMTKDAAKPPMKEEVSSNGESEMMDDEDNYGASAMMQRLREMKRKKG